MGCCESCSSVILYGGKTDSLGLEYCDDRCLKKSEILKTSEKLPADLIQSQLERVFKGGCPECTGPGPVDIHFVHTVWSAVVYTTWQSRPLMTCRQCATKAQMKAMATSLLLGLWAVPLGPIMALVQAGRNLGGITAGPSPVRPSKHLQRAIKIRLAEQYKEVGEQASYQRRMSMR